MKKYSVIKNFGHFTQVWHVVANSKEDAWERAEFDGTLEYQSVYEDPVDLSSKGYVKELDENKASGIDTSTYYRWMGEAIQKGMIVTTKEHEAAFNEIFNNDIKY